MQLGCILCLFNMLCFWHMLISEVYRRRPKTVSPEDSIVSVIRRMEKADVNGFVVVDDHKKVVGVISLQDIAGAIVPSEFKDNPGMAMAMYKEHFFHDLCHELEQVPVKKIMRKKFLSVNLETNILAVLADFLVGDLYIVPVIEAGKLIGIVTRSEIKDAIQSGMTH